MITEVVVIEEVKIVEVDVILGLTTLIVRDILEVKAVLIY